MKKEILYRNFMITPSKFLPVVDQKSESFIGFLSKSRIISEMSNLDIEEENEENEISKELLEFDISDELLSYFDSHSKIPVLNMRGEKISLWTKTKILLEYNNKVEEKTKEEVENTIIEDNGYNESEKINWFLRLVLENLSEPLLVTDLKGKTILYNESFEKNILPLEFFKDSIMTCESKLSKILKNNKHLFKKVLDWTVISNFGKGINYDLHFKVISEDGNNTGYIYQFILRNDYNIIEEKSSNQNFKFDTNLSFSKNIDNYEKFCIENALIKNLWNISKTAKILKIPRTTLQNKVRHFQIKKK